MNYLCLKNGFGMKDYTSIEIEIKKLDDYGFTEYLQL